MQLKLTLKSRPVSKSDRNLVNLPSIHYGGNESSSWADDKKPLLPSLHSVITSGSDFGRKKLHLERPSHIYWSLWTMGVGSFTGFGILVTIIWILSSQRGTECCNSKLSGIPWPFPSKEVPPNETDLSSNSDPGDLDLNFDLVPDPKKSAILLQIRHKMMSLSLKYIVDFILRSENFKFSCPSGHNATVNANATALYPDQLDCQKYYICDTAGRQTSGRCANGQGFDNVSQSCVDHNKVQLCSDVGLYPGFNCSSIGLHPFIGDCNRFALCTQVGVGAYVSNCNPGDYFHPQLLICLSSTESEC